MLYHTLKELSLHRYLKEAGKAPSMKSSKRPMLCGEGSVALEKVLAKLDPDDPVSLARACGRVFDFFGGDSGMSEFWEAAKLCLANSEVDSAAVSDGGFGYGLSEGSSAKSIPHKSEVIKFGLAEAQNLESIRMRRGAMGGGIGGMKKNEQIRKAAEAYALCGDLRKYCDLLYELGEHERALAVAPGVGLEYWREMSVEFARKQAEELNEDCVVFFAASGAAEEGVDFYAKRNQFKQAFSLAAAADAGFFVGAEGSRVGGGGGGGGKGGGGGNEEEKEIERNSLDDSAAPRERSNSLVNTGSSAFVLRATAQQMSDHYSSLGKGVMAATSFIATNDAKRALGSLLDSEQFLLALALGKCAGMDDDDDGRLEEQEKAFVVKSWMGDEDAEETRGRVFRDTNAESSERGEGKE